MSIARVTMADLKDEESFNRAQDIYNANRDFWFPNLDQIIDVQTGPNSLCSIALYPSFEEASKNLEGREAMIAAMEPYLKEQFFYEGEVIRNQKLK